jgi:hypothetical protein
VQRGRGYAGHERREPVRDSGEDRGDRPQREPDDVRDRQQQAEERRQPRAAQVVREHQPHGVLRRRLEGREHPVGVAVRIHVGEQERVRQHVRPVADRERPCVAQTARHLTPHERCEPTEERADDREEAAVHVGRVRGDAAVAAEAAAGGSDEPAAEHRAEQPGRNREEDAEQRLPSDLRRAGCPAISVTNQLTMATKITAIDQRVIQM